MASEPPPSSSSFSLCRPRKYDVYLSYSCNDTRKNFADPLYEVLKGAGINVFRDDTELQVGESISEKLVEAIKCSEISVIIFSKDYAASRRCLEEVEKIYECWRTFLQPVIPIIYEDPQRTFPREFGKHYGRSATDKMKRFWFDLTGPNSVNRPRKWLTECNGDEKYFQANLQYILGLVKYIQKNWVTNGHQIGKLFVSQKEIARGSNGTIVFEGTYSGILVAVKRILKTNHDVAFKENQILIESDNHQNIVRLYGEENDPNFVYLALEKCTCNLDDLIQIYSNSSQHSSFSDEWVGSPENIIGVIELWNKSRRPSPLLLKLMSDVVFGLQHLHELGIIHRDLKPQNVLIKKEVSLYAKLSDMGISKPLHPGESSLGTQATVCGTSGWKARERLLCGRQTLAVDLFSLGCILFFCITGGRHPFGDHFERDYNIVNNQVYLSLVEHIPEAVDLFSPLLNPDPELRPEAWMVLQHPFFWDSEKRLSFIRDTSDRVELEVSKATNSDFLKALENIKPQTFGARWNTKMEPAFINNILLHKRYKFGSVRDLLRVMRNKLNHYIELPEKIKEILGPVPEGFDDYFASRFPKLFIEVAKVCAYHCRKEEWYQKYLKF